MYVLLAYTLATLAGYILIGQLGDYTPLERILYADIAATLVIFVSSVLANNSSMYDAYWSVIPGLIAAYYIYLDPAPTRSWIIFVLVELYAIRLTVNWIKGWPGIQHEDWRYVDFRKNVGNWYWLVSLAGLHFFPTVMVFLGCIALYPAMLLPQVELNWLDYLAAFVTFAAVAIEYISDEQMRTFRANPDNKGKVMTSGLWAWSRHPNYVGETMFWFGLFLFCLASNADWVWYSLIGPVAMYLMFQFASIPMMEKRSAARRPNYLDATKDIPVYLPYKLPKK
jgi:steroid 5-alpha reductase family enzyme